MKKHPDTKKVSSVFCGYGWWYIRHFCRELIKAWDSKRKKCKGLMCKAKYCLISSLQCSVAISCNVKKLLHVFCFKFQLFLGIVGFFSALKYGLAIQYTWTCFHSEKLAVLQTSGQYLYSCNWWTCVTNRMPLHHNDKELSGSAPEVLNV